MRILITGANRGIGLGLVRESLGRGATVFATCRDPEGAHALQSLVREHPDRLFITALDVTDAQSIDASYQHVSRHTDALDVLVNNAGVRPRGERPGNLDRDTLLHTLEVNSVAPLMIAQRYLDLLRGGDSPRIVNITSQLGSLARKRSGGDYSYNASKSALNMLSKALAYDVRAMGITVVMIHPGWVQSEIGGQGAPLTPEESARGMLDVIEGLTPDDTARYLQWDGGELPW